MTDARARAATLLAEALMLEPDEIGPETSLAETEAWDSLAHMRLILALEAVLERPLEAEEIVGIEAAGDVEALLAGE